mmetsp:Transcript_31432/g.41628  ORF Transcript_31432/g.41628 Transcript_31432/m.41628 type:complete len:160 (-) Transcript_31432:517-996(-)
MTRLSEYLTPVVKKDLFVTSNMEVDPVIALHMDIVFPNTPCGILDFKFQTGYSTLQRKEMEQFSFLDINRATNDAIGEAPLVMDLASQEKYDTIKEQLESGQGCRVQGQHDMYQVPSKLIFATDRDLWIINKLKTEEPETYNKFSLEHYFEQLSFGDIS